jgi:hypothetical protein
MHTHAHLGIFHRGLMATMFAEPVCVISLESAPNADYALVANDGEAAMERRRLSVRCWPEGPYERFCSPSGEILPQPWCADDDHLPIPTAITK